MSLQRIMGYALVMVAGLLALGMLMLSGCSSQPDPASPGGGDDAVNLSRPTVTPTSPLTGQTTIVEVTATNASSQPISALSVSFVVSPTAGGYFTPPTATTNSNGIASTVFTPSQTGTMSIGAVSGTAQSLYTNITVSSNQQSSGNMSIEVTPTLLTADGASSSSVTVTVADINGDPAPESTVVKFVAGERFDDVDGNGYFNVGDSLMFDYNANDTWDPVGFIPANAYTHDGSVTVTYTAGTEATTAYIKATVTGTQDYDGSVETSVQLTPDAEIYAIELSTDVTGLQVRHTGGLETTNLHAICYDVYGNLVPEGQAVNFVITNGPGGGENIAGQGLGPVTAFTNSKGIATVPLWSGTISGTLRLYASAGTVLSNATFLAVYAGPPYYLAVGTDFCNLAGWNTVNRNMYVTAAVSDIYHNPVQDTTVVYFTVDEGIVDAYGITADSTGVAQAIFRTGEPQTDGIVWLWAETSGGTVVGSTYFINSYIPAYANMSMTPQRLLANGKSEATFWVDVRDLNDNYVVDATPVETKTIYGTASSGETSDGCHASIYEGTYTSATLEQDNSMAGGQDDGIGGIDIITARSGFVSGSVVCTLTTAFAFYDESSISMEASSIPYGSTDVPIRVVVKDRYGNPLGDHTLVATATRGAIVPGTGTQESNAFGEAYGFLFDAPADSTGGKSAIISVTDTDPRGGGLVLSTNVTFSAKK
jgi:adhesin/invasin